MRYVPGYDLRCALLCCCLGLGFLVTSRQACATLKTDCHVGVVPARRIRRRRNIRRDDWRCLLQVDRYARTVAVSCEVGCGPGNDLGCALSAHSLGLWTRCE